MYYTNLIKIKFYESVFENILRIWYLEYNGNPRSEMQFLEMLHNITHLPWFAEEQLIIKYQCKYEHIFDYFKFKLVEKKMQIKFHNCDLRTKARFRLLYKNCARAHLIKYCEISFERAKQECNPRFQKLSFEFTEK